MSEFELSAPPFGHLGAIERPELPPVMAPIAPKKRGPRRVAAEADVANPAAPKKTAKKQGRPKKPLQAMAMVIPVFSLLDTAKLQPEDIDPIIKAWQHLYGLDYAVRTRILDMLAKARS